MSGKKRKKFSREFKIEALRQVEQSGKPLAQVARDLGLSANLLHGWKRQFSESVNSAEVFPGNGVSSPEAEENRRLRRRLAEVEQERDILKKAAAYFAQESK